jgi:hypothetical protein
MEKLVKIIGGFVPETEVEYPVSANLIYNSLNIIEGICFDLPSNDFNFLRIMDRNNPFVSNKVLYGKFENGTDFTLTTPLVHSVNMDDIIHVKYWVTSMETSIPRNRDNISNKKWIIKLSNMKIYHGDCKTDIPAPLPESISEEQWKEYEKLAAKCKEIFPQPDQAENINSNPPEKCQRKIISGGICYNKILFCWKNRQCELIDNKFRDWKKEEEKNINIPIETASLIVPYVDGDTEETIASYTYEITLLLSFALGRDVKPCTFHLFENETEINSYHYTLEIHPFNQYRFPLIDNWNTYNIKNFIESAEQEFTSDRKWWIVTIELFNQAAISKIVDLQGALFNILLNRIANKINGKPQGTEISSQIPIVIKNPEFKNELHKILSCWIGDEWKEERTQSLMNMISEWNSAPSFPHAVIRACENLNIEPMSKARINFRHQLLHDGNFDKKINNLNEKVKYILELKGMVALLILRRLRFEGYVYLEHYNSHNWIKILDLITDCQTNS